MRRSPKPVIVAIAVAAAAATIAACSSSSGTSAGSSASTSSSAGGRVTLKGIWVSAVTAFHTAHPNVTIQNVPHQNEFFKTNMPIALKSNNPPDMPP